MPKEKMPVSLEKEPIEKLKDSVSRRRKLFDRLAGSPWAWAATAVLALESQTGCATIARGACYATLEPNCSGIDYDVSVRQQRPEQMRPTTSEREARTTESHGLNAQQSGGVSTPGGVWYGPRAEVKSLPPRGSASIQSMPEGFYSPAVARAIRERRVQVPPAFIDLEAGGYRPSGEIFSVVHAEVDEKAKPAELQASRLAVLNRGMRYVAPYLDYDQGARTDWHVAKRPGEKTSIVSCRVTVSADSPYLNRNAPVLPGESLEHSILTDQRKLEGGKVYFSQEKSATDQDRPAQAAAMVWFELPPEFFEAKAKQDAIQWKIKEASAKFDALNRECMGHHSDPAFARKCAELDKLDADLIKLNAELKKAASGMATAARAIQTIKFRMMEQLAAGLMPHISSGNEMRFHVRFDWAGQKLQLIAILDNPLTPTGNH